MPPPQSSVPFRVLCSLNLLPGIQRTHPRAPSLEGRPFDHSFYWKLVLIQDLIRPSLESGPPLGCPSCPFWSFTSLSTHSSPIPPWSVAGWGPAWGWWASCFLGQCANRYASSPQSRWKREGRDVALLPVTTHSVFPLHLGAVLHKTCVKPYCPWELQLCQMWLRGGCRLKSCQDLAGR